LTYSRSQVVLGKAGDAKLNLATGFWFPSQAWEPKENLFIFKVVAKIILAGATGFPACAGLV
jgi:hypothetical protein